MCFGASIFAGQPPTVQPAGTDLSRTAPEATLQLLTADRFSAQYPTHHQSTPPNSNIVSQSWIACSQLSEAGWLLAPLAAFARGARRQGAHALADRNAPKQGGASADKYVVAKDWVAVARFCAGGPESCAVKEGAVNAHLQPSGDKGQVDRWPMSSKLTLAVSPMTTPEAWSIMRPLPSTAAGCRSMPKTSDTRDCSK
eukprot:scaffold5034_cov385-Prasinococcus_capsulatus_cf.AAC.3